VIREDHFTTMKDGAIVCNSGHFNVEVEIERRDAKGNLIGGLEKLAKAKRTIREFVEEYTLADGRRINLLGEGRLVNLAAAEGHPSSVMDMSFANQALSAEYLAKHGRELKPLVYPVPKEIDREIARLKLTAMGITIDTLSKEQHDYLTSWEMGT
jgi:adenosylhomocysteinase